MNAIVATQCVALGELARVPAQSFGHLDGEKPRPVGIELLLRRGERRKIEGPLTTPPGKRVQTLNPPGSEVGPGQVATWGSSTELRTNGFGFTWTGDKWSSKHIPFDWSGPDPA